MEKCEYYVGKDSDFIVSGNNNIVSLATSNSKKKVGLCSLVEAGEPDPFCSSPSLSCLLRRYTKGELNLEEAQQLASGV